MSEGKKTQKKTMEPCLELFLSRNIPENVYDRVLLLSSLKEMTDALECLRREPAVPLRVLDEEGCARLREAVGKLEFRACSPVVNRGEQAVTQDFEISLNFPMETELDLFAAAFERQFNKALESLSPQPYPTPLYFNDRAVLRYPEGSSGISPHQDLLRFECVVAIITLEGQGDFYCCDDRLKSNSQKITASPGVMILMRGNRYADFQNRPFHYVEGLEKGRISFGLRYNARFTEEQSYGYN